MYANKNFGGFMWLFSINWDQLQDSSGHFFQFNFQSYDYPFVHVFFLSIRNEPSNNKKNGCQNLTKKKKKRLSKDFFFYNDHSENKGD